jgi:hypothetical protein
MDRPAEGGQAGGMIGWWRNSLEEGQIGGRIDGGWERFVVGLAGGETGW